MDNVFGTRIFVGTFTVIITVGNYSYLQLLQFLSPRCHSRTLQVDRNLLLAVRPSGIGDPEHGRCTQQGNVGRFRLHPRTIKIHPALAPQQSVDTNPERWQTGGVNSLSATFLLRHISELLHCAIVSPCRYHISSSSFNHRTSLVRGSGRCRKARGVASSDGSSRHGYKADTRDDGRRRSLKQDFFIHFFSHFGCYPIIRW